VTAAIIPFLKVKAAFPALPRKKVPVFMLVLEKVEIESISSLLKAGSNS
jgi:hypothetical protein